MRERERFRRLIGSDPATEPTPVVSRLRGTPYADAPRGAVPDDVLESMDLVLRVAAIAIRGGSGMRDAESMMIASAAALGLADEYLEYDLTFTSATVSYSPPGVDPVVRVRVVRSPGRDLSRLTALHEYVADLVSGRLAPVDAKIKLAEVESSNRPYRRSLVRVAWAVMTALIVLRLGGDWVAIATSFAATILIEGVGQWLRARGTPWPLITLAGSIIAAVAAVGVGGVDASGLGRLDPDVVRRTTLVVAGGVMMLLPGLQLVSVIEDGLWDYPLSATARLFQAMLGTGAILAGVGAVFSFAPNLGADVPPLMDPLRHSLAAPAWTYLLIVFAATIAAAIGNRVAPRLLLPAGAAGATGVGVLLGCQWLGLSSQLGTLLGALAIGALGRVWALRAKATPLAIVVPAITMLLPGLAVVEALRQISGAGDPTDGLIRLLGAGTTAAAIAFGSVLGSMLAASVERGAGAAELLRRGVWRRRLPQDV